MEKDLYDRIHQLQDFHWWYAGRRRFLKEIFKNELPPPSGGRVLDVGCGCGSMLEFLGGGGCFVMGIDDSAYALEFCKAKKNAGLVRATARQLPFKDNSFDLVSCFEVLSHNRIGDDRLVLKELYRVCKKGGTVIVADSAFEFLRGKHDAAAHAVRRYTLKELCSKVEAGGFALRRKTFLYLCLLAPVLVVRVFKNTFFKGAGPKAELSRAPRLVNALVIFLLSIEAFLLKKFDLPFGVSVLCVAKKV